MKTPMLNISPSAYVLFIFTVNKKKKQFHLCNSVHTLVIIFIFEIFSILKDFRSNPQTQMQRVTNMSISCFEIKSLVLKI